MCVLAWLLLIFMCNVILKQPCKIWEAQILYTKTSLVFFRGQFF